MSDMAISDQTPERRRILFSLGVAFVVHVVILFLLALGPGRALFELPPKSIPIDIELAGVPPVEQVTVPSSNGGPQPGGAAAIPRAASTQGASTNAGVDAAGFVIPTPRAQTTDQPTSAGGSGFRVSGTQTGVAQALPNIADQPSLATIAATQTGKGSGTGANTGQATGAMQRSGQGVSVTGGTGSATNLDLSQVDKTLAGTKGGGGSGGSGGGTGGGSGQGTTGTSGSGTGDQSVVWDYPDASAGRVLLASPAPNLPAWVAAQGLSLSVGVSFTLAPDGLLSRISIDKSSGYADVDSAVIDAIRRWRFSPAKVSVSVTGRIPYTIRAK